MNFQGGGWNNGDAVELSNLTIGTSSGTADIYNGTGTTITFTNGIQTGSGTSVMFASPINFTNGTFSCSSGDSTTITFSGHMQVVQPDTTIYEEFDFSHDYSFGGGGNGFYYNGPTDHDVELTSVSLNVSNFDQSTTT